MNNSGGILASLTCGRLRVAENDVTVTGGCLHLDKEQLETRILNYHKPLYYLYIYIYI